MSTQIRIPTQPPTQADASANDNTMTSNGLQFRAAYALDKSVSAFTTPADNVLVTGFWRSGTTWVQESLARSLNAKTIFEPFSPKASPPFNRQRRFKRRDQQRREAIIPTDFATFTSQDLNFIDEIFSGACPARFSFLCRKDLSESFKRRVIIKLVRGQLIIPELINRFGVKVVHVTRHPGAVISSFLSTDWDWTFQDVSFKHILPEPDRARPELRADIEKLQTVYASRRDYERIAAYWAFTEKHVHNTQHPNLIKTSYEDLVHQGGDAFNNVTDFLGGQSREDISLSAPSVVTVSDRMNATPRDRTHAWKKKLSPKARERIASAICDIWPVGADRYSDLTAPD